MKVFSKRKWVEKSLEFGMSISDIEEGLGSWVSVCDGLPKEVCIKLGFIIWDENCIDTEEQEESKTTESSEVKPTKKIFRKEKCLRVMKEWGEKVNFPSFVLEMILKDGEDWMDEMDGLDKETCERRGYNVDDRWCETV